MRSLSVFRRRLPIVVGLSILAATAACAPRVTRVDPDRTIDLSGRWNDSDSRMVAEALIDQSFDAAHGASWAARFMQAHGEQPTVIVGTVANRSLEHIPVGTFVRELEQAYVNSGIVRVVAGRDERREVRDERLDQQEWSAPDTRARLQREYGADFMLQGEIQSIEDVDRGRRVVYYQVDMTLVDLETNEKSWIGQHRIKKFVERPRYGR